LDEKKKKMERERTKGEDGKKEKKKRGKGADLRGSGTTECQRRYGMEWKYQE
jgi:hypothetical protein